MDNFEESSGMTQFWFNTCWQTWYFRHYSKCWSSYILITHNKSCKIFVHLPLDLRERCNDMAMSDWGQWASVLSPDIIGSYQAINQLRFCLCGWNAEWQRFALCMWWSAPLVGLASRCVMCYLSRIMLHVLFKNPSYICRLSIIWWVM